MKQDFRHAFLQALDRGIAEPEGKWVFFDACVLLGLAPDWLKALKCEQGLRSRFLELERASFEVSAHLEINADQSGAIVFAGRNRKVNELNCIRAWNACREGGRVLVAGDKTSGIGSLRKWVSGRAEIIDSFSKFHAVVFWFERQGDAWVLPETVKAVAGYSTADGMFSSDGPDAGSQLLAEHFDKRIGGRVADLGAGWGFLSAELLEKCNKIESLGLYENDFQSLEAAKKNLASASGIPVSYHWCDLTTEFKKTPFNWVVMNPPFHSGRAAEPELGKKFIAIAASTLPSGGRLLMVANRNLPYEESLKRLFKKSVTLEARDGFKVMEAVK